MEATTVVNYSKEQVFSSIMIIIMIIIVMMMTLMTLMIMLTKVSKLLEEGRLREGVVLVNYRFLPVH